MLEIWYMEYEDSAPIEMDGKPVTFDDMADAVRFIKIFNLHRSLGDQAWIWDKR